MTPGEEIKIINRKGFTLPVTGGFGTLLFSGIGVLLVLAGVGVLFSLKKKSTVHNAHHPNTHSKINGVIHREGPETVLPLWAVVAVRQPLQKGSLQWKPPSN